MRGKRSWAYLLAIAVVWVVLTAVGLELGLKVRDVIRLRTGPYAVHQGLIYDVALHDQMHASDFVPQDSIIKAGVSYVREQELDDWDSELDVQCSDLGINIVYIWYEGVVLESTVIIQDNTGVCGEEGP